VGGEGRFEDRLEGPSPGRHHRRLHGGGTDPRGGRGPHQGGVSAGHAVRHRGERNPTRAADRPWSASPPFLAPRGGGGGVPRPPLSPGGQPRHRLQRDGRIAGKRIVEPTSGNTGIALAALSNLLGIPCTITIPSGAPEEKIALLRLLGAEVWPTPDDLCPVDHPKDGAIALARTFVTSEATRDRDVMPNQHENPDNVAAHYETTGPEIWKQTEGKVTHSLAGYGTCGTITGVAKYLK